MPGMVATQIVKQVKRRAAGSDERVDMLALFATDIVSYVAADDSNQVAISANIHGLAGMKWPSR